MTEEGKSRKRSWKKMREDENKEPNSKASLNHKKCTGDDNWQRFIATQGIKANTNKPKIHDLKVNKVKDDPVLTKVVGMDCEMVGVGDGGRQSVLARVSLVNKYGDCIYDKFVKSREPVTDYRTFVSGIRETDLINAESFEEVQKEVAAIIKKKVLVGHSLKNDLDVLFLSHPKWLIRDTSKFFKKKRKGTPSLKNLALEYLNVRIQEGEHSSVQDAKAAVQLYNLYKNKWDACVWLKRPASIETPDHRIKEYFERNDINVL